MRRLRSEPAFVAGALLVPVAMATLVLSYGSFEPLVALAMFMAFGMALLFLPVIGGAVERRAYILTFSIGVFWSGIAAVYANQFQDFQQLQGDAAFFYELATTWLSEDHVFAQTGITDSTGPMIVWHHVYQIFRAMDFSDGRYIGIAVNTFFVAASAVLGVKCVRLAYGGDVPRTRLYILAFALMPMLGIFSGMFMREAMILFSLMALLTVWVALLAAPTPWRLAALLLASTVAYLYFHYLRGEFVLVPIAMLLAGGVSLLLASPRSQDGLSQRLVGLSLLVVAGLLYWAPLLAELATMLQGIGIFLPEWAGVSTEIGVAQKEYADLARVEAGDGGTGPGESLGLKLIINQPDYIRIVLGSIYVWVFPIPFWVGFQLESFYHLTKSLQAIFNYFLIPALAVVLWKTFTLFRLERSALTLFLILCLGGFTVAIAATSIETRHLGTFLPMFLLLAVQPDWSQAGNRLLLRNLTLLTLAGVFLVHAAWLVLRGVS